MNAETDKRQQAFTSIYADKHWGDTNLSGAGSSLDATTMTREIIHKVIHEYNINSIVDVACGDFVWMPYLLEKMSEEVRYTGCDIVESLVEEHAKHYPQYRFQALDFVEGKIPQGELILCRDALQHLAVKDIKKALANFSASGAKFLLTTTNPRLFGFKNGMNIRTGKCRERNLMAPPFNLPNPLALYSEQSIYEGKFLGLWRLPFDSRSGLSSS